jgi:hypothetical protein
MSEIVVCELGKSQATAGRLQTLFGAFDLADEIPGQRLAFVAQPDEEFRELRNDRNSTPGIRSLFGVNPAALFASGFLPGGTLFREIACLRSLRTPNTAHSFFGGVFFWLSGHSEG